MRYPELVPAWVRTTPIRLVIWDGTLTEDGEPAVVFDRELMCCWQDGGSVELTAEQRYEKLTGRAYFGGDICPGIPVITAGYGVTGGVRRELAQGIKARNPDGTVNYTEVRFR